MIEAELHKLWADDDVWAFATGTGRRLVAELEPPELELFDELAASLRREDGSTGSDDPLAFGLDMLDPSTTAAVLVLVGNGILFVLKEVFTGGVEVLKDVAKDRLKKARELDKVPFPEITAQQALRLRAELLAQAKRIGIDGNRASLLVDATLECLIAPSPK